MNKPNKLKAGAMVLVVVGAVVTFAALARGAGIFFIGLGLGLIIAGIVILVEMSAAWKGTMDSRKKSREEQKN
ncbi:MAG: hypothetical protein LBQ96_01750 [Fusobacteriaceae bacterium]|jgi:hypothetical protein|nr:hypothetical protein [Fusobacteriaceae bacterium]